MTKTTLHIIDEVNIKFSDLDPACRRKMVESLEFMLPYARHTPAFKLGRWNGKTSFCDIGARSYLNLLDVLLPIVQNHGYDVEINDHRNPTQDFVFEEVESDSYSHIKWPKGHPKAGEPIDIREHQLDVINSYLNNITGINIAPTGAGKAQPLYSRIKTPTGWSTMADIKIGDYVSTPTGAVSSVVGIFPQGKKDIYRITFSDGRTTDCCKDHLWKVYNKHWATKWKIIDTAELIRLKTETSGTYYVPLLTGDSQEDISLPLEPYFMGLLLGDGSFRNGQLGFSTSDIELVAYIESILDNEYYLKKLPGAYDYAICIRKEIYDRLRNTAGNLKDTGMFHKYRKIITELGLNHKLSHEKFIPNIYKFSSIAQKELLIAGLVDTDGYIGKNGEISISTSSEQMAKDIQEIVRSIGGISLIKSKIPSYTYLGEMKNGIRNYTVTIRYPKRKLLSKLPRKLKRISNNYQYADLKLGIDSIELIGNEEAQCIMVDHADHLYITDDFIITHNTIITAILSHKVEPYGRSIVIVPTKDLVTQTEEDYINFGLDVGVFYGDRKEYNKTHTICTWQSLESLNKRSKEQELEVDINDFFEGVVCVIVDEVHKAKADVLRKILSTYLANAPIRWGLTGTMPEEEADKVGVRACIGPLLGQINTKELQEKGILAKLHIDVWQLQDVGMAASGNYQTELKWLTTNKKRLEFLAESSIAIAETGNTLILVDRVETGEMLQSMIPDSIFVSGAMKSSDRKKEYKEVQEVDGKVIIATYGVASTGINIVRIFNLVLFEAGKSFVRVIQSIGRGIRVAADKDFVNVYDVCSNCKYSKSHLTKRKKFYKEAEYPFTVKKVTY